MMTLLQIAYQEIKRIDPDAKAISPTFLAADYDKLNQMLNLGMGNYCDIISWHLYFSPAARGDGNDRQLHSVHARTASSE